MRRKVRRVGPESGGAHRPVGVKEAWNMVLGLLEGMALKKYYGTKLNKQAAMKGYKGITNAISKYDVDDVLDLVGLKRASTASSVASTIGLLVGGIALGAVLGMAFAPRAGRELRESIAQRGIPGLRGNKETTTSPTALS